MTEERPPNAGGIGPLKRLGVIVVVVVFTWWVERGFKALIAALS